MSSGQRREQWTEALGNDPTGSSGDLMLVQAAELHEQPPENRQPGQKQVGTKHFTGRSKGDAGTQYGRGHEKKGERRDELHVCET